MPKLHEKAKAVDASVVYAVRQGAVEGTGAMPGLQADKA